VREGGAAPRRSTRASGEPGGRGERGGQRPLRNARSLAKIGLMPQAEKRDTVPLGRVLALIQSAESAYARFPPTLLFNEGWILRLVLDWFSSHPSSTSALGFQPGTSWFSEALLPTPFAPRSRGDPRGETRTHADGVFGHIQIGASAKTDLRVSTEATQFVVVEAKMYSPLSRGTRNAPKFGQAARNVACMAETLSRAQRPPSHLKSLAFLVLAPETQVSVPGFTASLEKSSIEEAVRLRAVQFAPALDVWIDQWFLPTLQAADVRALTWEDVLADVRVRDIEAYDELSAFYSRCQKDNAPARPATPA